MHETHPSRAVREREAATARGGCTSAARGPGRRSHEALARDQELECRLRGGRLRGTARIGGLHRRRWFALGGGHAHRGTDAEHDRGAPGGNGDTEYGHVEPGDLGGDR
ncbi:hypothetical protein NUM_50740 [Actinocatenispora comari]|uniref:Uncharacterized protein n=1 Tax=Actinocatenispora comari TaxID=2807577 RepID=A0A8J4AFR1_9ACTN|nr:hypothetical protein NUM_50740 [Actinocatenispora comari]